MSFHDTIRHFPSGPAATLAAALGLALLSAPVHAGGVSVKEGEKATFQITATHKYGSHASATIRLWYDTDGGTAVEGTDYETAHSWKHNVQGTAGSPVTISVKTFEDDAVESDETFNIRIRRLQVQGYGWRGARVWRTQSLGDWNFKGVKTATIKDTTPQEHDSYEDEKYGEGYTGTVFGE